MSGLLRMGTGVLASRLGLATPPMPKTRNTPFLSPPHPSATVQVKTLARKCGPPKGKKYGSKVYDGQRVQAGAILVAQLRLGIFPGWNVRFGKHNDLRSLCHGRVMFTIEKCDPKYGEGDEQVEKNFPTHIRHKNIFRLHVHVLPDEQHQYFRLMEQV